MAKAKKTKAGSWRVQLYLGRDPNGKQIIKSITAPTKREAEAKALEYKTRGVVPSRDTVQNAITEYIGNRSALLSPATLRDYKAIERALATLLFLRICSRNILYLRGFFDIVR